MSIAEFIKGPLAHCYKGLFNRNAGGNERGPFARFGTAFFKIVGYPIAPATIVREVKEAPRIKKQQQRLRLVHRVA